MSERRVPNIYVSPGLPSKPDAQSKPSAADGLGRSEETSAPPPPTHFIRSANTNTNTNTNANTNATTSIDYGLRFLYQKQNTGHALGAC